MTNQLMTDIAYNIVNVKCFTITYYLKNGGNTVNHNLGNKITGLKIFDNMGNEMVVDWWKNIDENNVYIEIYLNYSGICLIDCYII